MSNILHLILPVIFPKAAAVIRKTKRYERKGAQFSDLVSWENTLKS